MQRFTELAVWQRSHSLVLDVYRLTLTFPPEEKFTLVSQLLRAALSVPTNIAEGSKRVGRLEYARFLNIAEGSVAETQYLLMVGRDLGYLSYQAHDTTQKQLSGFSLTCNFELSTLSSVQSCRGKERGD